MAQFTKNLFWNNNANRSLTGRPLGPAPTRFQGRAQGAPVRERTPAPGLVVSWQQLPLHSCSCYWASQLPSPRGR